MASKFLNRNVIGILVITLIFGVISAISIYRMYGNLDQKDPDEVVKKDYILMLEERLGIALDGQDDFENLSLIGYDTIIEPIEYANHYKPCFNFSITPSGVVIKNGLSKEYYDYNFTPGMLITHINGKELSGLGYFEILELLYASSKGEKVFTINGEDIKYSYGVLNDRVYYDEKNNRLYVYNVDKITQRVIHDYYLDNPGLVLDLSMATVNTFDAIYEFISLFVSKDVMLFTNLDGVYAKDNKRKINSITIDLGENSDQGILFMATTIYKFNSNVNFSKQTDVTSFYAMSKINTSKYTVYISDLKLQNKTPESSGGTSI